MIDREREEMIRDASEIAKVRKNLEAWLIAFNAKDLKTLFTLYDRESLYANAAAPLMRGVDQIRPWYEQAVGNVAGTLLHKEEAAAQDGNLAMILGAYYFQPPADSEPSAEEPLTGRVVLIYRRNEEGAWKLFFDMDNSPPDINPATFA